MTLSNKRIKSAYQIVRMRRLVRAFFVRKPPKTGISRRGPLSLLRWDYCSNDATCCHHYAQIETFLTG